LIEEAAMSRFLGEFVFVDEARIAGAPRASTARRPRTPFGCARHYFDFNAKNH
jgi:hypothetical protein